MVPVVELDQVERVHTSALYVGDLLVVRGVYMDEGTSELRVLRVAQVYNRPNTVEVVLSTIAGDSREVPGRFPITLPAAGWLDVVATATELAGLQAQVVR